MPDAPASSSRLPGLRPTTTEPYPLARLARLLDARAADDGPLAGQVSGVAFDSRAVRPGDLYVALPGAKTHGARFVDSVLAAGAAAVLTDAAGAQVLERSATPSTRPVLIVDDARRAMATAAAEVYGRPATKLIMLGVTGTNGKTTTNYLLSAGLRAVGRSTGVIGTLGYFLDGTEIATDRTTITTPESPDLQALLAVLVERGADAVVMEVSSHALALGRVDDIVFDVAGFTNFGRDHLDFHGTVEAYFEAKAKLFTPEHAHRVVINSDDPRGAELIGRARSAGLPITTTSVAGTGSLASPQQPDDQDATELRFCAVDYSDSDPVVVRIAAPQGEFDFRLGLPGSYNVANAVTALAMLSAIGIDPRAAAAGLAGVAVPGRLQRVELGSGAPRAYVDFAHTPQAVASVLTELGRTLGPGRSGRTGRLICVVGCGGDRDPDKRGPMGQTAAELADVVIITDDNPRTEDPAAIRAAALRGARQQAATGGNRVSVLDGGDRAAAIRQALTIAGPADVIALLGKGHERGQEIGGRVLAFDDTEQLISTWQHRIPSGADGRPGNHRPEKES